MNYQREFIHVADIAANGQTEGHICTHLILFSTFCLFSWNFIFFSTILLSSRYFVFFLDISLFFSKWTMNINLPLIISFSGPAPILLDLWSFFTLKKFSSSWIKITSDIFWGIFRTFSRLVLTSTCRQAGFWRVHALLTTWRDWKPRAGAHRLARWCLDRIGPALSGQTDGTLLLWYRHSSSLDLDHPLLIIPLTKWLHLVGERRFVKKTVDCLSACERSLGC